eukprot:TRINITY_DN7210_c0_g1_i1.p1 TRINITY_DN7210_c0_g1~~TRINITY_DN7210_c0_g1_i1.p1  ORF type:complete len:656 (-),score=127.09 TRINITY_DN7210_c0_g1_i1:63-2030(-)
MDAYGAGRHEEEIGHFARHWGLDISAIDWLRSLPAEVRVTILREFSPRCSPHDVSRMLFSFGRSVQARHEASGNLPPELTHFAMRWGLDASVMGWLLSLPLEVRSVVVREFAPVDCHGGAVVAKLKAFVRSVEGRLRSGVPGPAGMSPAAGCQGAPADDAAAGQGHAAGGCMLQDLDPNDPYDPYAAGDPEAQDGEAAVPLKELGSSELEFADRWGLDDMARNVLASLPEDIQRTVVEQFEPRGDLVHASAKMVAFARSVQATRDAAQRGVAMVDDADIELVRNFAAKWSLDEDTEAFMFSLDTEVRMMVLRDFDPVEGTQDIGRKLRAFARSRSDVLHGAQHAGASAVAGHGHGFSLACAPNSEERAFLERWGLAASSEAAGVLASLVPAVRLRVMREFAPAGVTRDPLRLLAGFANSVARTAAAEGGCGSMGCGSMGCGSMGCGSMGCGAMGFGCMGHSPETGMGFRGQPGHFVHDGRGDPARFADAAPLMRSGPAGAFFRGGRPGYPAELHGTLPPQGGLYGAHLGQRAFPPTRPRLPPDHMESGRFRPGGAAVGNEVAASVPLTLARQAFADEWRLDTAARQFLGDLPEEIASTVMAEFRPRAVGDDCSIKFCGFARAVAARMERGDPRGVKRAPFEDQAALPAARYPRMR